MISTDNSGTQNALPFRTLQDLRFRIAVDPTKITSTYGLTTDLLEKYFDKPADQILLDELLEARYILGFRSYLEKTFDYKPNSLRTFVARYTTLRNHAIEYGYQRKIPVAFETLCQSPRATVCEEYLCHFASLDPNPDNITLLAVEQLTKELNEKKYRNYCQQRRRMNEFLLLLREGGYTRQQPLATARMDYGVSLGNMPEPLKSQVEELRTAILFGSQFGQSSAWKQMPWDIPQVGDLQLLEGSGTRRERTAENAIYAVSLLFGFAKIVCEQQGGMNLDDFAGLKSILDRDFVKSFVNFSLRVRLKEGDSVRNPLASLFAGIQRCTNLRDIDLTWTEELLDNIPRTPQGQRDKSKEDRYVELAELDKIPNLMQADRRKEERRLKNAIANQEKSVGPSTTHKRRTQETEIRNLRKRIAHMVMTELLIRWLIIWPWRGSNLCACRIGADNNPNLYLAPIRPSIMVDIPKEVQKIIDAAPHTEFWQVYLSSKEHKTGRKTQKEIRTLFPLELVPYLEAFLAVRSDLLQKDALGNSIDHGRLLANMGGSALKLPNLEYLIENTVFNYAGAPMNPHLFRDALSDDCMKHRPQDSEHVAKGLFQSSDKTLKRNYSARHNASGGASYLDKLARERRQKHEAEMTTARKPYIPKMPRP